MRVPAAPRPSPARGAQIAAAMRFPAAGAGHPGHRSGAHDAARSARDAPAERQRLLGGRPQFICFAGAPLLCPRPIRLKDARTCAAVRRRRLLGAAAHPSRRRAKPLQDGGGGGIRTHERLAPLPVFKTGAMNRSATPPRVASVATSRDGGVVLASTIWHTAPP